jgi:hypothetical protein
LISRNRGSKQGEEVDPKSEYPKELTRMDPERSEDKEEGEEERGYGP